MTLFVFINKISWVNFKKMKKFIIIIIVIFLREINFIRFIKQNYKTKIYTKNYNTKI